MFPDEMHACRSATARRQKAPVAPQAWAVVPMAVLCACSGGLLSALWMISSMLQLDLHGLERMALLSLRASGELGDALGPGWIEDFVGDITRLGGSSVLGLAGLIIAGYLAALRQWASLPFLVISLLGGMLAGDLSKSLIERPRPDLVPHLVEVSSMSLPSGHATNSAVAYLTFSALLVRAVPDIARVYVVAAAIFITMLVGSSRIYLGVHYPSDVLAGWSLGSAWALASWFAAHPAIRR